MASKAEQLQALRDQLAALHSNKQLDPEEKDQQARKIRRSIRKLAAELGEPSRSPSSTTHSTEGRKAKKAKMQDLYLSQIKVVNARGEEVDSLEPAKAMTKAERRAARRARRAELKASGITPQMLEAVKPAAPYRKSIADKLVEKGLTEGAASENGYGFLLETWPASLDHAVSETTLEHSRDTILSQMLQKFETRMGEAAQWFYFLRSGEGLIVAFGPVPDGYPNVGKRSKHERAKFND